MQQLRHGFIDAHAHLMEDRFSDPVLAEADRLGISHFVVANIGAYLQHPSADDLRRVNDECAALVRRDPDRFSGYAYLNPELGLRACRDELSRCYDLGLVGVKLWVATTADDPVAVQVVRAAARFRMPVLAHAWDKAVGQLPHESTADHIAGLARAVPEATIIMAHLGGFVPWAMDTIAPYENVVTDTCGSVNGAGDVDHAVRTLGARRVVFGTDTPGICLASNVGKVADAQLDAASAMLVMRDNMARILGEVQR